MKEEASMADRGISCTKPKLHIVMFPWFGYGHLIPYLHLSNKLAERGHRVSFLLPNGASRRLDTQNQYIELITFFPLDVPHVDGLPLDAETASDIPFHLQNQLFTAFDKTQDQVETILRALKPDFVFFDFAPWVPALALQVNAMSVQYLIMVAASLALIMVPSKRIAEKIVPEEFLQPPPGYPSSTVIFRSWEAPRLVSSPDYVEKWVRMYKLITTGMKKSDIIALRACKETDGQFCDYLAHQYQKTVLLTGPLLPNSGKQLEKDFAEWLCRFEAGSVVYCAFGSQIKLQKKQYQELLLGFESTGLPFLVALSPPIGCLTAEEAMPVGFQAKVQERGWVSGGWVPQMAILDHPSVGCFVSHCGLNSLWESLLSDSQIVLVPHLPDQKLGTRLMVEDLKVAVEVERSGTDGWISKENLNKAIKLVMDKESELAANLRNNHAKLKKAVLREDVQENYIDTFIHQLQNL